MTISFEKLLKTANVVLVLTILQFIYAIAINNDSELSEAKKLHEDLIFIIHLMTFFVLSALDDILKTKENK